MHCLALNELDIGNAVARSRLDQAEMQQKSRRTQAVEEFDDFELHKIAYSY